MAADHRGGLQLSSGHDLPHPAPDAGSLDPHHLTRLDIIGNRVVGRTQAGGCDGQFFQSQLLNSGLHHHVYHIVPIPEMVVERKGHTICGFALPKRLCDGFHHLAFLRLLAAPGLWGGFLDVSAVHVVFPLINFPPSGQQGIGNFPSNCIFHIRSPSYIPQARARRSVRSAPGIKAMSIILPSTVNTPTPAADCSR